jgi:predicted dienelactone hydrolase
MVTGIALASNREMKRFLALIAALLISSCCSSLSDLVNPQYQIKSGEGTSSIPPGAGLKPVTTTDLVFHDASRNRDVPVKIYRSADRSARLPVVIFSHGIGEDRDSYSYLGREWAAHGYMAVHITHAGTDKAVLKTGYWNLYKATKKKENWVNRPLDVTFVLDQLAKRDDTDMNRVAVAGHSAGAFTALAVAGMRFEGGETFADPRVKVAIAISMPKMNGIVDAAGYAPIRIPMLHMTGTCDTSLIYRTNARDRRVPFEASTGPDQYLVTLEGVTHDTFSNAEDAAHPVIARITTMFLDAFLSGNASAREVFERGFPGTSGVAVERKSMR